MAVKSKRKLCIAQNIAIDLLFSCAQMSVSSCFFFFYMIWMISKAKANTPYKSYLIFWASPKSSPHLYSASLHLLLLLASLFFRGIKIDLQDSSTVKQELIWITDFPVLHTEIFYSFYLSSALTHPYQTSSSQTTHQLTPFSLSSSS